MRIDFSSPMLHIIHCMMIFMNSLGNGNESLTTPGMNRYSKKMCCMCVMLIVLGATLIIATSLTVTLIVLISFNFKEIFEKINIHSDINIIPVNLMNYSDEFAISANDTVIVPNEPYPGSDIINLIIYPTSKINLKEIDLYKVSKTLPAKSRPVNVSDSLHVSIGDSDRLHLLDKRYVLNGTKLDITVNVTAYNSKQRKKNMDCLVEVYLFNTHESFTSFLKNLSEFEHANPCRLPQCLCITPDGQPHPLVSDISQSYKFTVVNTTLQEEDAIISYRINGTEYYYDGSDYPVSCSVPDKGKGTNKCNLTIAQSQDMVLALTKDEDEEYDVEMKYEIEVQQLKVQCQASNPLTMYICLWVLAGALFIFLLFGIILCCVISHVLYVILRTST